MLNDILNNINNNSIILCINCSSKLINSINSVCNNVHYYSKFLKFSHIFIGQNQLLELDFFKYIDFNNKLKIILEKQLNSITNYTIDVSLSLEYGFIKNKEENNEYVIYSFSRDSVLILYYIYEKDLPNINICEKNIIKYAKKLRYNLKIIKNSKFKDCVERIQSIIENLKNFEYILVLNNYSIIVNFSMNINKLITMFISKNKFLFLDDTYPINNLLIKNSLVAIDILDEFKCITHKSDFYKKYLEINSFKNIELDQLNLFFNNNKTYKNSKNLFEFIIILDNVYNNSSNVNNDAVNYINKFPRISGIWEKNSKKINRFFKNKQHDILSLLIYYSNIYKLKNEPYNNIKLKKYIYGSKINKELLGYLKFYDNYFLHNEEKGRYIKYTKHCYQININNLNYNLTFFNDFNDFFGYEIITNEEIFGFLIE